MKKKAEKVNFKVNTPYAITISPNDKCQFIGRPERLQRFRHFWYEMFLKQGFKYEIFIEISEPLNQSQLKQGSLGPRLHLHGVIEFRTTKEIGQFLLYTIYKYLRVGNVYIHTISDPDVWQGYYNKQKLFKNNRLSSYSIKTKPIK